MNQSFVWRQTTDGTKALVATGWKTNIAQMVKHDHKGGGDECIIPPHTNERYAFEDFDQDYRAKGTGSVPII